MTYGHYAKNKGGKRVLGTKFCALCELFRASNVASQIDAAQQWWGLEFILLILK